MENVNILIVEDDLSFASLLQERLVLLGYSSYDIVSIDAIAQAMEVKEEFTPDVILLDLNIRDSSGIATYDRIQSIFDEATIIVLSGMDNRALSLEIVAKGAQDYLLKNEINAGVLDKTIKYGILRRTFQVQLTESEKKYKDLFYNSPLPMLKLSVSSYEILFCNQAALTLFDASTANEIVGKSLNEFIISDQNLSAEDNSPRWMGYYKQRTLTEQEISTQIILNQLTEDKEAYIALVVDKTDELLFEQRKYDIIAQAEEGEKKKIARELHDGIGQQLVLLNLLLQNITPVPAEAGALGQIKQLLQGSIQELREMAYNLLPPALEKGFLNALERFAHRINATGKMTLTLSIDDQINEESFVNVDRFNLYRIVQEVLNNALKHSKASQITIEIHPIKGSKINLKVVDNGIGFDTDRMSEGLGMQNMKHRMDMAGIKGSISSEKGRGVIVELMFKG
ncbi:MAG: response regulator [Flavobacteriales bacterium]|jgi:signal transduction histidine kinase